MSCRNAWLLVTSRPSSLLSRFLASTTLSLRGADSNPPNYERSIRHIIQLGSVCIFAASTCWAQASPAAPSDPQAVGLASKSIAAMVGNNSIQDATLRGTASWVSGANQTGTITLSALGASESRVELTLPSGTHIEIRDGSTGISLGKWINPDATSGTFAGHNTMTDAVWFFPALSSLVPSPNTVLSYVGLETRNGESVQHLRSRLYQASPPADPTLTDQQLSTMDFYLDSGSYLPVSVVFNRHPDNNARVDIPVEVTFSDYQTVAGVEVPMRIHESMNGAPLLDITLSSATFNSGLSLTTFSVNE